MKVATRIHEYVYENGMMRRHDDDSNQPIQKHIGVHTKPLNGVSIRKNVSCGSL